MTVERCPPSAWNRVRHRVEYAEEDGGVFYWPDGTPTDSPVPFRWPAQEDTTRGLEEICERELASLARWVLLLGKSGEDALTQMAREVGLLKLRSASRGRLESVLAKVST